LSLASIWNVRSNHPKDTQTALHRSNIFPLQFWTETNSVIQISDIYVAATGGKTSQQILYGYICSSRKKWHHVFYVTTHVYNLKQKQTILLSTPEHPLLLTWIYGGPPLRKLYCRAGMTYSVLTNVSRLPRMACKNQLLA
jgi:hypothetical protein